MTRTTYRSLSGLLIAAALGAAPAYAQPATPSPDQETRCSELMQRKQDWYKQAQEMDATLEKQAAEMNAATGQKKIDAMAAVLNTLVEERQMAREHWQKMRKESAESMGNCPMMEGMPHGPHGKSMGMKP